MHQKTLLSSPLDLFEYELKNPPADYEDVCSDWLWKRARSARLYAGSEAVIYTKRPARKRRTKRMAGKTPEYSEGFKCGSAGGSALHCPYKRNTWVRQQWEAGFTAGIAIFRRDRCEEAVTESRGMRLGADCRVVRGRAEY